MIVVLGKLIIKKPPKLMSGIEVPRSDLFQVIF